MYPRLCNELVDDKVDGSCYADLNKIYFSPFCVVCGDSVVTVFRLRIENIRFYRILYQLYPIVRRYCVKISSKIKINFT